MPVQRPFRMPTAPAPCLGPGSVRESHPTPVPSPTVRSWARDGPWRPVGLCHARRPGSACVEWSGWVGLSGHPAKGPVQGMSWPVTSPPSPLVSGEGQPAAQQSSITCRGGNCTAIGLSLIPCWLHRGGTGGGSRPGSQGQGPARARFSIRFKMQTDLQEMRLVAPSPACAPARTDGRPSSGRDKTAAWLRDRRSATRCRAATTPPPQRCTGALLGIHYLGSSILKAR